MKPASNSLATISTRLLKFAERPPWVEGIAEHWDAFLEFAADFLERTPDEVAEALDALGLESMAFAMVFEDFATQRDEAGRSFLADYLKRRGWRESAPARQYVQALAHSVLGLYEIVAVQRDRGFWLRDLLDAGRVPFFVHERRATHHLFRWDIVAARVLLLMNRHQFSGGLLRLERQTYSHGLRPGWEQARNDPSSREAFMQGLPTLATLLWLGTTLDTAEATPPEVFDGDGEPLAPCTAWLPLRAGADAVAAALDAAPDWLRAVGEAPFWHWIDGAPERQAERDTGSSMLTYTESGKVVRGSVQLEDEQLIFSTLSAARMERGLARLRECLGDALGEPVVEQHALHDERQASPPRGDATPDTPAAGADPIPPEVAAQVVQATLDRHYRAVLDQPLPALGDLTPRQAAADPRTRERAIDWLKDLENHETRRSARDGLPPYDARGLWTALGLEIPQGMGRADEKA